jgi:hypothetical protein
MRCPAVSWSLIDMVWCDAKRLRLLPRVRREVDILANEHAIRLALEARVAYGRCRSSAATGSPPL